MRRAKPVTAADIEALLPFIETFKRPGFVFAKWASEEGVIRLAGNYEYSPEAQDFQGGRSKRGCGGGAGGVNLGRTESVWFGRRWPRPLPYGGSVGSKAIAVPAGSRRPSSRSRTRLEGDGGGPEAASATFLGTFERLVHSGGCGHSPRPRRASGSRRPSGRL